MTTLRTTATLTERLGLVFCAALAAILPIAAILAVLEAL
jgi:hypothetical protein